MHLIPWVKGCTSEWPTSDSQQEFATFHEKARFLKLDNAEICSRLQPSQKAGDIQAPYLGMNAWGLLCHWPLSEIQERPLYQLLTMKELMPSKPTYSVPETPRSDLKSPHCFKETILSESEITRAHFLTAVLHPQHLEQPRVAHSGC